MVLSTLASSYIVKGTVGKKEKTQKINWLRLFSLLITITFSARATILTLNLWLKPTSLLVLVNFGAILALTYVSFYCGWPKKARRIAVSAGAVFAVASIFNIVLYFRLSPNLGLSLFIYSIDLVVPFCFFYSSYWLAQTRHYQLASWLLVSGIVLYVVELYLLNSAQIPAMLVFVVAIALALALLESWEVWLITAFSVIFILVIQLAVNLFQVYVPLNSITSRESVALNTIIFYAISIPIAVFLLVVPGKERTNLLKAQNRQLEEALLEISLRQQFGEEVSRQVLNLTAELKITAEQQAGGSYQQISALTQVNTALNELSTTANHILQQAEEVSQATNLMHQDSRHIEATAYLSVEQSQRGLAAVDRTVEVSGEVAELYQELVETMQALTTRSTNMRRILVLLSTIASETHLLALNAAIEAAGSGENSARFRVVASEVKNLATRSHSASQEVVKIVKEIEIALRMVATSAGEGYRKAREMEEVARQAGKVIEEMGAISQQSFTQASTIGQIAGQIHSLSELIKTATAQQHIATQQVLEVLNGLNVIASQNTAGSSLVTSTAIRLEEMSGNLNKVLGAATSVEQKVEIISRTN